MGGPRIFAGSSQALVPVGRQYESGLVPAAAGQARRISRRALSRTGSSETGLLNRIETPECESNREVSGIHASDSDIFSSGLFSSRAGFSSRLMARARNRQDSEDGGIQRTAGSHRLGRTGPGDPQDEGCSRAKSYLRRVRTRTNRVRASGTERSVPFPDGLKSSLERGRRFGEGTRPLWGEATRLSKDRNGPA